MVKQSLADPLIVIIGATGTGKSLLAVELATKFNGEVINGDAMQMYDGLPIITNKITVEEQNGIPHHLLGIVGLDEEPWRVGHFKRKAASVIKEIRSRGKLPVLVGGTHYYTQSLLFRDALISHAEQSKETVEKELSRDEINQRYPILEKPTEEILKMLRTVDPVMANRWHPNDRRKIQRSLEIYLTSGKQASKVYEEQQERINLSQSNDSSVAELYTENDLLTQSTLILWVHADSEVLSKRLDDRLDKMIKSGLLEEVEALDDFAQKQKVTGTFIDRTSGIWVSIGFKEFEPYIKRMRSGELSSKELDILYSTALEKTKAATRQYAKRQIRWIRLKLLPALSKQSALRNIYLLDGSNLQHWLASVSNPAIEITEKFLAKEDLPPPSNISSTASEFLAPKRDFKFSDRRDLWIRQTCELCSVTAVTDEQWQRHIKGRSHRRALKKSRKNASHSIFQAPNEDVPADRKSTRSEAGNIEQGTM